MFSTLLGKYLIPIVALISMGAGMLFQARVLAPKCPKIEFPKCPDCNCPPAVNTIDFDKIKGFKGTIQLNQNYKVEMDGDSLAMEAFQKAVRDELIKLKVTRCK